VIVISAQNTIMTTIKATEAKAFDYLPKPFDLPDLMKRSAKALALQNTIAPPTTPPQNTASDLPLVGRTGVMQGLYRLIAQIINNDLPVLIRGENGTGKSLIARIIHDFSDRRAAAFVVTSASDISGAEAMEKIFARAYGGTLVIDEIGDLDAKAQALVARKIDQLGENAPRLMATSQIDLAPRMEAGDFRQDLYYRLNGVGLMVPALRDRIDDIGPLAEYFLGRNPAGGSAGNAVAHHLSQGAHERMQGYSWPGNVRQLENCLHRLCATSGQAQISRAEVEQALGGQPAMDTIAENTQGDKLSASIARHLQRYFDLHGEALPPPGVYARVLQEMERPLLEISLEATGGNQAKCADLLGINRNTLRKKITELDIRVTRRRKLM